MLYLIVNLSTQNDKSHARLAERLHDGTYLEEWRNINFIDTDDRFIIREGIHPVASFPKSQITVIHRNF